MKKIRFIFLFIFHFVLFTFHLNAKTFTVASYNVENLFDLKYDGTEYKEFIPDTKQWNKRIYFNKLKYISKTIKHLNADIIALQEIESQKALDDLQKKLSIYKYSLFFKKQTSSVGVALLSKFPIIKHSKIDVNKNDNYARDILQVTVNIENKSLILFINHWRSKRAKESQRIIYATALKHKLDKLDILADYIIIGDLNSNYNEYTTFKYDKKLNDTYDITGINQVLNTTLNGNFIKKDIILKYKKRVHYNLWLDLNNKNRFSSKFRGHNSTPDHIIVSSGLFDTKNISYKNESFKVFKPSYLYQNSKINRWNNHKQSGYSDHLPIYATFTTSKFKNSTIKQIKYSKNTISSLYDIDTLNNNIDLKNIIVIYKYKNNAILKQQNNRAILSFNNAKAFKLGFSYDIQVDNIDEYFGLKEIKSISNIITKKRLNKDIKYFYLDARKIDIFNPIYQNEILKNLRGKYKKGYLYYKNSKGLHKIKLYFNKEIKRPKDNSMITILSGHLSCYKSQIQIAIHKNSDFKINR